MTKIYDKNNSKVLNQVEKLLISNLQKKYYLREKNLNLLNNILRIKETKTITPLMPQIITPPMPQIITPRKTCLQKTSDIDYIVKKETLMTYFVNEFVNFLYSSN